MAIAAPFNLKKWINENRNLLKPPVGNQCVYKDASNFIVMVVGGPNARKDYHYNESEELYYQVEGNIVLKIIDNGEFKDIPINEGDMFLLPPRTPHSPQRGPNTVGLVIEKVRETVRIQDGGNRYRKAVAAGDGRVLWFARAADLWGVWGGDDEAGVES
jgi:3-hydroxyanthranilate 3,4-dioxygenase